MKYARGENYDAEKYWNDRFIKYGNSLKGPGNEGMTEEENHNMYAEASLAFTSFCLEQDIRFKHKRILEVGCGTGYYTDLISTLGEHIEYTGIDITDAMFNELKTRHPSYRFFKADITKPLPDMGTFDAVVMIDVVEHIVTIQGFNVAMQNVKQLLAQNGVFIVAPIAPRNKGHLYYVHWWPLSVYKESFREFRIGTPYPFRKKEIVAIFS